MRPGESWYEVLQSIARWGEKTLGGIVQKVLVTEDRGLQTTIDCVDNREWLHRESVYCTFNNVEIIEDNVATPGIDRKKRFWHILPADWLEQKKTYTDQPLTVMEILYRKGWAAPDILPDAIESGK